MKQVFQKYIQLVVLVIVVLIIDIIDRIFGTTFSDNEFVLLIAYVTALYCNICDRFDNIEQMLAW